MQQEQIQAEAIAWQQGTLISTLSATTYRPPTHPATIPVAAKCCCIVDSWNDSCPPAHSCSYDIRMPQPRHPPCMAAATPLHVLTVGGLHPEPFRPARQTEPALPVWHCLLPCLPSALRSPHCRGLSFCCCCRCHCLQNQRMQPQPAGTLPISVHCCQHCCQQCQQQQQLELRRWRCH